MTIPLPLLSVAMVSIAASSAFYTWIWYKPNSFKSLVKPQDPCQVMAKLAHVLKIVQFSSMLLATDWVAAAKLSVLHWAFLAVCVAFGQHLNYHVYRLLGVDGVYYGFRFGKSIPWVTSYPYSAMRDPQYIGCIATLLGCSVLMPTELVLWWLANYFYLMWLESKVPTASV